MSNAEVNEAFFQEEKAEAVAEERERCAAIADAFPHYIGASIAAAIRQGIESVDVQVTDEGVRWKSK